MAIRRKKSVIVAPGEKITSPEKASYSGRSEQQTLHADKAVLLAQQLLKKLNYYQGPEDGSLNDDTRGALEDFQIDYGLRLSGEADRETLNLLRKLGG